MRPIDKYTEPQFAADRSAGAAQRLSALGEMTSGLAHDFRNILAVIAAGLRLAEKHAHDPKQVHAFVSGALEGVTRGERLISQLLTFAQQETIQMFPTDANALLKKLELFLRYGAGSGVEVVLDLSPSLPKCDVDPSQFAAAILNLVLNARDAMPNGGMVRISTSQCQLNAKESIEVTSERYVRVRVQDDGCGMPDDVLEKIFDRFFTTKGDKGTGLGVPQVYRLMHDVGGHMRVMSEQGRGTTVDLLFPARAPKRAVSHAPSVRREAAEMASHC